MKILITGSAGLIGSEVSVHLGKKGHVIHGIDNNQREVFFGFAGNTSQSLLRVEQALSSNYHHYSIDIRDREKINELFKSEQFHAIVHTAAQPSHDKAAQIPYDDFETNALGTLNLLEAARQHCPEAPFVFLSTNKVYGDRPNDLEMQELEKRYDFAQEEFQKGINESFNIDQSKHSLFGASKVSADILVQEYGRYFDMPTMCLRGGCLTGPNHSGVELHGFLSYLIKCNVTKTPYTIFGYKGKQVRDNIHSSDVANLIECMIEAPRQGEVYNVGGGKENTCSILEAFDAIEVLSQIPMTYTYSEQARSGDHICYYSDLRKTKRHFPKWEICKPLGTIFEDIFNSWKQKM